MSIPARCDVVVIGGGPAGSMAATHMARRGFDVVLFDRVRHPRYAVGESLTPHIWRYCELAGVDRAIADEGFIEKTGGTAMWQGTIRQMSFKDFGYTRPALHVERDRFDFILLDHARAVGARIHEEVSVADVRIADGSDTKVSYRHVGDAGGEIACRYVIDASGQHSVLCRQLGLRTTDTSFRFMSMWGYFEDSKYIASDGHAHPFDRLREIPPTTFVTSVQQFGEWGWLWHIPLRKDTSIGIVLPVEQLKSLSRDAGGDTLETLFVRACHETPVVDRLLEGARYCEGQFRVVRDYSYYSTRLAGPGFFLAGDAAAFVDPIFSQGVPVAMYSGAFAAEAIHQCLARPERTPAIQELYHRQLRARIEVSRSLALPRYDASGGVTDMARQCLHYISSAEQELMFVASTLTNRSGNLKDMNWKGEESVTSSKYRVLEAIQF